MIVHHINTFNKVWPVKYNALLRLKSSLKTRQSLIAYKYQQLLLPFKFCKFKGNLIENGRIGYICHEKQMLNRFMQNWQTCNIFKTTESFSIKRMMNSITKNVQVISGFLLCADYTTTFSVKWEKYSFIEWGSRSWRDEINTNYALSKYCSFSLPQLKLLKCMFLLNIFLPVLI